jgi:hypothetical protein
MNLRVIVFGLACVFIAGTSSAQSEAPRVQAKAPATAACTCTSVPFVPKVPCENFCVSQFMLFVPTARLKMTLKLTPTVEAAVASAKKGSLDESQFKAFIASPEGTAFKNAFSVSNRKDVADLLGEYGKTSVRDGRAAQP